MQLRQYQEDAIDAVLGASCARPVVVLPTGAGKTLTAAALARRFAAVNGGRIVFIAHREELLAQTEETFNKGWPDHPRIGWVKAGRRETDAPIILASVQSLNEARCAEILTAGPLGLVFADEMHHYASATFKAALDRLPCALRVGLTATPKRGDAHRLTDVFDEIVYEQDALWAIHNGYLVEPKAITVKVDLSAAKVNRGDYTDGSLSDVLFEQGAQVLVARTIFEHASERTTIVFCPTLEFADAIAEECQALGLRSGVVKGDTPTEVRRALYADLAAGRLSVLASCMVLTEGFDCPKVDCAVIARPTKSESLFIQMAGRALRLHPGKSDALIICLGGTAKMKLATVATLAGKSLDPKVAARLDELLEDDEQGSLIELIDAVEREFAEQAQLIVSHVYLLGVAKQKVSWAEFGEGGVAKSLGDRRTIVVKHRPTLDRWDTLLVENVNADGRWFTRRTEIESGSADACLSAAEAWIVREGLRGMTDPNARWRSDPASAGQIAAVTKANLVFSPGATKGDLSDLMDREFTRKAFNTA